MKTLKSSRVILCHGILWIQLKLQTYETRILIIINIALWHYQNIVQSVSLITSMIENYDQFFCILLKHSCNEDSFEICTVF